MHLFMYYIKCIIIYLYRLVKGPPLGVKNVKIQENFEKIRDPKQPFLGPSFQSFSDFPIFYTWGGREEVLRVAELI